MSGPLNYTTKVPVSRTVSEVTQLLASHGASAVATMYDNGAAVGLTFSLPTPAGEQVFRLPVIVEGVQRQLIEISPSTPAGRRQSSPEHAARVAWRQIKDWVEAQVAIIESGMATLEQVMLPYLQVEPGRTLYEVYAARGYALEAAR
jgi:hypothetical protein